MAAERSQRSRPLVLDLFCGAGGMSLGFERAGFDIALGIDVDGYHIATHERNFPYGKSLCRSVSELTAGGICAVLGSQIDIDLVIGGPPCQGFSHMGLRDIKDPRNSLVSDFVRLIREIRPKAFVMENVPGLLTGSTRPLLDEALRGFESAGYRITTPLRVLNASDFGVPQHRRRLIVLGLRDDIPGELRYPQEPPEGSPALPTVWEAIADLPNVDACEELLSRDWTPYDAAPYSGYAAAMRGQQAMKRDYSHPRRWDREFCTGCHRVRHSPKAIDLYSRTPMGEMVPGHKLPKLDPGGVAPTLRAGSDSTHGSYTAPRPIHPFKPRCITVREAARLHGFPDWFGFYPLKWHGYRQIGNAVCPPVAHAIGLQVIRALGLRPSKSRRAIELGDRFVLPPNRLRGQKRIPQVEHFPPVIEKLFLELFDPETGTLRKSTFTFSDVQRAIIATGAALTWVRSDTFLREVARSRNVVKLLEPCLRFGFTIRRCESAKVIGEFVPKGHPDGLELKSKRQLPTFIASEGITRGKKTLF